MTTARVAARLAVVCFLLTVRTGNAQQGLFTVTPCRILDTRNPAGPYGGPRMAAGQTRAFTIAGTCGVPANATAVAINLAVVAPSAAGFAQIYPGDGAPPITSILNFRAGKTRANDAIVALASNASGTIKLVNNSVGSADYALDVSGYFAPPCGTITVTNPATNSGLAGAAFSQTFTETGAQSGATFTVATGSLPGGWTLSTAGVLSNPNPAPGQFTITVKVTDGFGCIGTGGSYTVTITPVAGDDAYGPSVVGNMSIDTSTGTVFSVLTNDTAGSTANLLGGGATAQGGQVALNPATGTFTYNPPRGFTGADSFQYTVTNNGQASAAATVSLTVAGMAWFIDNNPGACSASCDGRRTNPFPTLIAFETVNNGSGSNPKSGDSVFFYESATVYDGPFVPLSGQRTVGQDATTSFATAMNLTVPDTTVAVPVMNSANGTTTTISAPSSSMTFVLQPDCALIGMTIVASTGNAVWGTSVLGTITISDVQMQASGTADGFRLQSAFSGNIGITGGSITQSGTGFAVVLSSIAVNVSVGSLVDASGGQAVYVSQFAGAVNFNGAVSAHGNATGITVIKNADAAVNFNGPVNLGTVASRLSGGTAVSVDHGNHAGGTTSFSSLTILTNGQQALAATNGGHLTVSGGNIDTLSGRVLNLSGLDVDLSFGSLSSIGSGGGQAVLLSGVSGSLAVAFSTSLSGHPNQGILVTGSTADASFGNTTINGGTDAISLQNNPAGTRSFGSLTIGNAISPSGIGFLHAVGGGNVSVAGPTSITNPLGSSAIDIESAAATTSIVFGGTTTVTKNTGTAVALGVPSANNLSGTLGFGTLNVTASNGTALSLGTTPLTAVGGTVSATNGPAILASGTAFNATFGSVSSQGSAGNGISLANATGSLTMIGGSIPSAGGTSFNVSGGTANVTYGGSITQNGAQFAVVVSGSSGGTKIFAGAVTSTGGGKGISLVANPGAAIAFTGTLTLNTGANPAFAASGGGTVTASGAGSTIATTTATAVNIGSTTIGAAGFTVQSVSSSGGSSTGIILDTTGAGAFSVTGSGTTSSGGGIGNKTGADGATSTGVGIYLNATTNPSFAWMQLNDFQNFAILGNNVTGLSLDHVFVSGTNGTLVTGAGEGDVYFTGLAGSASVTGCSFAGAAYDTFHVFNNSGQSLNRLAITGTTFGSMGVSGNNAVYLQATDGTFNVTVQSSSVTSARAYMLQLDLHGAVSSDLLLGGATAGLGNTLANNHSGIVAGKGGVLLSSGGAGENVTLTYNIASNTIRGAVGAALSVVKGAGTGGSFSGAINSNTVGTNGAPGSGSSQGDGIAVFHAQGGTSVTTITNNQVYGSSGTGAASIHVFINDSSGGNGKMTATIQANTVGTIGSASYAGVFAHAGAVAADQHRACFTVGGAGALQNAVNLLGAPTTYGYAMTQAGNTLVYGGGPTTAAGIATLLMANNLYLNAGIGFGTTASASTSYQASCPP